MGTGMIICGLNGAGKSTLGKALAEKLQFHFIDVEDLYFPKTDPNDIYAFPRNRGEVEKLLFGEINAQENFVFASVTGDYGEAICSFFRFAVWIECPKDTRIQRVMNRSFCKFGHRMCKGGDLYEREEHFFDFVRMRAEDTVEEWIKTFNRPVIRIDGTRPIEENINLIVRALGQSCRGDAASPERISAFE